MEGYIWKKGHAIPTFQRRFCVLRGSMLSYYTTEEEYKQDVIPRNVLEVVGINELDGHSGFIYFSNGFEIEYLGGKKYQCHTESMEDKQMWWSSIQDALSEPDRIAEREISEAQNILREELDQVQKAASLASSSIAIAKKNAQETLETSKMLDNLYTERQEVERELKKLSEDMREAEKKVVDIQETLGNCNEMVILKPKIPLDNQNDELKPNLALARQLEAEATYETSLRSEHEKLTQRLMEIARDIDALEVKKNQCIEEGKQRHEVAISSLKQANEAKKKLTLQINSWKVALSHLDPLIEGYLMYHHRIKLTMVRRYYVLYGNTVCWYLTSKNYHDHMDNPCGVVHVHGVGETNTNKPHSFTILTIEGKELHCCATTAEQKIKWLTALNVCLTMPPLSPHRAKIAKSKRDSFDLVTSVAATSQKLDDEATLFSIVSSSALQQPHKNLEERDIITVEECDMETVEKPNIATIEGHLMVRNSKDVLLHKKYCVLYSPQIFVYDSHEAYTKTIEATCKVDNHGLIAKSALEWDGKTCFHCYQHTFQIVTVDNQIFHFSASSEAIKLNWIKCFHEGIKKYSCQDFAENILLRKEGLLLNSVLHSDDLRDVSRDHLDGVKANVYNKNLQKLEVLVRKYFLDQHPEKIADVPILLSKYTNHEHELVQYIDQLYGANLAGSTEIEDILSVLASNSHTSTGIIQHNGENEFDLVEKKGSVIWMPLPSGHGDMNTQNEESFIVLSANKLARYCSHTHSELAPANPKEVLVIHKMWDLPNKNNIPNAAFGLSYSIDRKQEFGSNLYYEVLIIPQTLEEKYSWMEKIQIGLKLVITEQRSDANKLLQSLQEQLTIYYMKNNPLKAGDVDSLISYFSGREYQLLERLDAIHNTNLCSDQKILTITQQLANGYQKLNSIHLGFSNVDAKRKLNPVMSNILMSHEGYLWVKHKILGENFRKCYCVVQGTTWQCFDKSEHAKSGIADQSNTNSINSLNTKAKVVADSIPLICDTYVKLHSVNAQLKKMHAISIETKNHGVLLLRGSTDGIVEIWLHTLRYIIDFERSYVSDSVKSLKEDVDMTKEEAVRAYVYNALNSFYKIRNPTRLCEVVDLLNGFRGRELELLKRIDLIYHSNFATATEFINLWNKLYEYNEAIDQKKDCKTTILMQGYLMKRGNQNHSMRKRYCTLHACGELIYFETESDSLNPNIPPQGKFDVQMVSEWNGVTTTQVYEFGMELETIDCKKFFCSALSADDKKKWLHAFHRVIAYKDLKEKKKDPQCEAGNSDSNLSFQAYVKRNLVKFTTKLNDLDVLLNCYAGRERKLLEILDNLFGTALLQEKSIHSFLPPQNDFVEAMETLKYDRILLWVANNDPQQWNIAQEVQVVLDGSTIVFHEVRNGRDMGCKLNDASDVRPKVDLQGIKYKSKICELEIPYKILAVKDVPSDADSKRFAIEIDTHNWIFFEAPNAKEKLIWVKLLRASLNSVIAASIIADLPIEANENILIQSPLLMIPNFPMLTGLSNPSKINLVNEFKVILFSSNTIEIKNFEETTIAEFTVTLAQTWEPPNEVALLLPFAFQIDTIEQVSLFCSAQSANERLSWIRQCCIGIDRADTMELLEGQAQSELYQIHPSSRSDCKTSPESGKNYQTEEKSKKIGNAYYVIYQSLTSVAKENKPVEGYVTLNQRSEIFIYANENAFHLLSPPLYHAFVQRIEVNGPEANFYQINKINMSDSKIPYTSVSARLNFLVHTSNAEWNEIHLFPQSHIYREAWIRAFVNICNYENCALLLDDQKCDPESKQIMKQSNYIADDKMNTNVNNTLHNINIPNNNEQVHQTSGIIHDAILDGFLLLWHDNMFGMSRKPENSPLFGILTGSILRCFKSKDRVLQEDRSISTPYLQINISGVKSWQPSYPFTTFEEAGIVVQGTAKSETTTLSSGNMKEFYFTASCAQSKYHWLSAIHQELEFELAERHLDKDACEFMNEVLTASHHVTSNYQSVQAICFDGSLHVRHHHLGAMWHERFAILNNSNISVFRTKADAMKSLNDPTKRLIVEAHHIVSIIKTDSLQYDYSKTALFGSLHHDTKQLMFVIENEKGDLIECKVSSSNEYTEWVKNLEKAIQILESHELPTYMISRNPSLPLIAGSTIEGYLKVCEHKTNRKFSWNWHTRYCVLIGTHWFLYMLQDDAVTYMSPRVAGMDTTSQEPSMEQFTKQTAPTLAVEIAKVEPYSCDRGDINTHSILVSAVLNPTQSTTIVEYIARAHSALEAKRWLKAIKDSLSEGVSEIQQVKTNMNYQQALTLAKEKYKNVDEENSRMTVDVDNMLEQFAISSSDSDGDISTESGQTLHLDSHTLENKDRDCIFSLVSSSTGKNRFPTIPIGVTSILYNNADKGILDLSKVNNKHPDVKWCSLATFTCTKNKLKSSKNSHTLYDASLTDTIEINEWNKFYECEYYSEDM